jgi:hypothetical protein
MTKTEQAELLELGLTEAQIEQRAQEISAKLHEPRAEYINMVEVKGTPTRKRRSDAGKPKAKKAEAVPGVLTSEQVDELERRIANMMRTRSRKEIAVVECEAAQIAYESFIKLVSGKDAQ